MKTVWKWIILTVLIVYVISMTVWANAEAEKHQCRGISVSITGGGINDSITTEAVLDLLRQYPEKIVGIPATRVNTRGIQEYIMNLNNFEDVRCHITSQGYLSVSIQPMIPEIRVFDGDNSYYVNKDGKRITSNSAFYVDVPVVQGTFSNDFNPKDILPIVRFVERDSTLHNLITMYVARDKNNILLVPRFTGHVINFGDTSCLKEKKRALLTAYHNILPYRGWELYDTISVKFKGQIVATRRDKRPLYPFETIIEEEDPEEGSLPDDPNPQGPQQKPAQADNTNTNTDTTPTRTTTQG